MGNELYTGQAMAEDYLSKYSFTIVAFIAVFLVITPRMNQYYGPESRK